MVPLIFDRPRAYWDTLLDPGIVSGSPTNWVNDPFPGCEKTTLFVINPRSLDDPDQISYLISIYIYSIYIYDYICVYIIYVCLILVRLGNAPKPVG